MGTVYDSGPMIPYPNLKCYCKHVKHQHALGSEKCDNCNCSKFRTDLSETTDQELEAADPSQDMCVVPDSVAANRGATETLIPPEMKPATEWVEGGPRDSSLKRAIKTLTIKGEDIKEEKKSLRTELLEEANDLVTGDRNNSYGEPHQDFARTAGALTSFGYRGPDGRELQAHDVAIIIGVVKMSRLMWTPTKRDSWVDLAGYAACGFEAAELTLNNNEKETG